MASSIDRIFGQAGLLGQIQEHAARLARLDALLRATLPAHLAETCHVANLRQRELVVHADCGAAAAKLRQALPSLLATLQQQGAPVDGVKLRVRPPEPHRAAPTPAPRTVPAGAREELDALAASLPDDSPVAQALRRLVRNCG